MASSPLSLLDELNETKRAFPPIPPGARLRQVREELGLTAEAIEHRSRQIANYWDRPEYAVPVGHLSDYEAGRATPSIFRIYSLAAIFDLPVPEVLGWYIVGPLGLADVVVDPARVVPEEKSPLIGELVADLLTWYATENRLPQHEKDVRARWTRHLAPFFAEMKASALGTAQQRAYRAQRKAEGASDSTVNRELQILRKAYKLAADAEPPKVRHVPKFRFPKEDNARKVFIDPETAQKLKDAAAEEGLWARVFLELAFALGWRRSELQGLTVANIRLAEGTVRIEDSKNGEPREVALTPALRNLIEPLVLGKGAEESLWPVKRFRDPWTRICKAAGVKAGKKDGIILHDTRRTSARTKRAAGVAESVIMDLQGWKSSAMFRRYAICDQSDGLRALLQEEKFLEGIVKSAAPAQAIAPPPDEPPPEAAVAPPRRNRASRAEAAPPVEKTCAGWMVDAAGIIVSCPALFTTSDPRKAYHSPACHYQTRDLRRRHVLGDRCRLPQTTCEACGAELPVNNRWQRFCSEACREKSYPARRDPEKARAASRRYKAKKRAAAAQAKKPAAGQVELPAAEGAA